MTSAVTGWKACGMALLLMVSYSFLFFTRTILDTLSLNTALSQILTTPPYNFSAIVSIATGYLADRIQLHSPFIIARSVLTIIELVLTGWGGSTVARAVGLFLAITGNNCAILAVLGFLSIM
ncbi:hypothetical protein BDV12DRAFT_202132 [Aspergillus spectabilis]